MWHKNNPYSDELKMTSNHGKISKTIVNSSTIDDPWVKCDSTSHPGFKYYVNQRTGIKVWNITESEIEFAKKAAIGVEPQRLPSINPYKNEKICNQQASNQFSNVPENKISVRPFNVWENPQNLPPQNLAPQNLTPQNLGPQGQLQLYQFVPIALVQLPNKVPVHNTSLQMANTKQNQPPTWKSRNSKHWYNKRNKDNEFTHNNTDLREKLVRRKSVTESFNRNEEEKTRKWKDNTRIETVWEEASVQMSLAPLKSLTSAGSSSDQWHIVVDADVILKNYNYLNNMAAADPNCHLLVPYHVMSELQTYVSESNNVQARRILRFLTQQIESGLALLGDKVDGESACHMTINTCRELALQYTHVVLISSDIDTFDYETDLENLYAFTMQEIKDILENRSKKRIKLHRENSPTLAIKIVVPNNAINVASEGVFSMPSPRMDSTRTVVHENYTGDVSDTFSRMIVRTYNSTDELIANDPQNIISGTTSQNIFGSTELANFSGDANIFDATEMDSDSRETAEMASRITEKIENANDSADISGLISPGTIDTSGKANETEGMSGITSQRTTDTPVHPNDTRDMSGMTAQRMWNLFKHAKNKSRGVFDATKLTNDTISETSSRKSSVSAEVATDVIDISGTSRKNIDAGKPAHDDRDISDTTSQIIDESTELDNDARTKLSKDNKNQNLSTIPGEEFATGLSVPTKSQLKVQSGELYNPDCYRSPKSVSNYGTELVDVGQPSKNKFQSPAKMSDSNSPHSSATSASGHVSLDTVGMRKIISMKRLAGATDNDLVRKLPASSISSNNSDASIISTGILPQAIHKPSMSRSASYDSNSDSSGLKRNISENVIVEETSTSGVVSNTYSDTSQAEKPRNHNQNDGEEITPKMVMFEVVGQSMEDALKTRLDEWLFRFVQIMEELIRVKMQENLHRKVIQYKPPSKPPRGLPEALTCIVNKYTPNLNIMSAASVLSQIIFNMGDEKGTLNNNILPSEYMIMYSHGVHLVDTFLDACAECMENCMDDRKKDIASGSKEVYNADSCTCYDVKTASESLKKLLYDIQNDNQGTFVDHPHYSSTDNLNLDGDQYYDEIETNENNIVQVPEVKKSPDFSNEPEKTQRDGSNSSCSAYNLRPNRRESQSATSPYNLRPQRRKSVNKRNPRRICIQNTEDDASPQGKNTGQGIEVTFFNSLHLQRKDQGSDLTNDETTLAVEEKASDATDQAQTTEGPEKDLNIHNIKIHLNKDNSKKTAWKVVRNFTVNPDIEKKIKARKNEEEYEDSGGNEQGNQDKIMVDEKLTQYESENNNNISSEYNNKSSFFEKFVNKLKTIFTKISVLSKEYTLSEEKSEERNKLSLSLEQWLEHLDDMQNAFDGGIKGEPMTIDQQMLLKSIANVDCMPDANFFIEEREKIPIFKETADTFQKSIRSLLNIGQGPS